MLDGLQRLVELQRIDDALTQAQHQAAQLPVQRAAAQREREEAEQAAGDAREALETAELARREREGRLADQETLLARLEGQSAVVRSNTAYTALLHEIDAAKQGISDLETGILEAMEAIDSARQALAQADQDSSATSARVGEEELRLDALADDLAKDQERLQNARKEVVASIDPALVAQYDRIATRRRPAVAIVTKELCSGCRVQIPPQSAINLIRAETVIQCERCHRILVHERMLAGESVS